ncbi:MAG: tRNA dihydrouridine synthase DusB [Methylovulum sp.]|uniref:tRNA dihydrouridine synthase DusB n=1 Tax=Methylovulum sp. TaxID=1916980 RepID=UPI0026225F2C|nr:tRNA dihydrouridine synthase DusB [Methylovulum sp.]MDD2722497.1 tRNA dihydrouridine synthase DusB [Methylovulum sp.]MDD5125718.1 tRNA dihydrouridine synthase DusB [Methylovulum sp.]
MHIGPHQLANPLILAPMAGISDRPFRTVCRQFGAGLAVSEMVASNPALREHKRTLLRADHHGENGLRSIQILGTQPRQMAEAARLNAERGADIIDINMGCPAKKVCSVAAGSALLKNEELVKQILDAVVNAVAVPVTLKIRTGWDLQNRNAVTIAKIAEAAGIAALTIHGRTRACKFTGQAEYETIRQVKQAVSIPIIANGDIDSPEKAKQILDSTGADALMIGRAAQGNPWIFQQTNHFLNTGRRLAEPDMSSIQPILVGHLEALYRFYGDISGVRIARKHITWYCQALAMPQSIQNAINQAQLPAEQIALIDSFFHPLTNARAA